jgi:hypothetical protein
MEVVVEQHPGEAVGSCLGQQKAKAGEEAFAVVIVQEDGASFDPPDDDVLEQAWDVDAGMSWHVRDKRGETLKIKNVPFSRERPLFPLSIHWVSNTKTRCPYSCTTNTTSRSAS